MKKLNVLLISSWYPSKEHPTLGNFVQKHAEAINELVNLKVLFVTPSTTLKSDFTVENSINNKVDTTIVYYHETKQSIPIISTIKSAIRYKKAFKIGLKAIQTSTNFKQIDITHCNVTFQSSLFANYLKNKHSIPYLITEHSTVFSNKKNVFRNIPFAQKILIQIGIKNASAIAPVSIQLKNDMLSLGLKNDYHVIANIIDTKLFKPKQTQSSKKATILHISHLDNQQKNSLGILTVIKKLSEQRQDFVLRIIADDNIEYAETLIKSLNIPKSVVQLDTIKSTTEVARAYQDASFFLLYSNYETFSVVLAEAWSSGLPVVYSKCGGLTELNDKKLGIQIQPKDDEILLKSLHQMLDNYHQYDSNLIREFAISKFDKQSVAIAYLKLYQKIIKANEV